MAALPADMSIVNIVQPTPKVKSDILHYLHTNSSRSSEANLIEACKDHFSSTAILEAKKYLLSECNGILADIDNKLISKFAKRRRNTSGRHCSNVILIDIIEIMKAIQGSDLDIDILPNKASNIPSVNPEHLTMHSISERIDLHDSQFVKLSEHEQMVKDMIVLTRENEILKADVKKLTEWMNICVTSKSGNPDGGQRAAATEPVPLPTPPSETTLHTLPTINTPHSHPTQTLTTDIASHTPPHTAILHPSPAVHTLPPHTAPDTIPTATPYPTHTDPPAATSNLSPPPPPSFPQPTLDALALPPALTDRKVPPHINTGTGSLPSLANQGATFTVPSFFNQGNPFSVGQQLAPQGSNANGARQKTKLATFRGKPKHGKDISQATKAAITAAVYAHNGGANLQEAVLIGENTAVEYSDPKPIVAKAGILGSDGIHTEKSGGPARAGNLGLPLPMPISNPTPQNIAQQNSDKKGLTYRRGTSSDPKRSLGDNKPMFLNNKCLVIQGISKNLSMAEVKNKINATANKKILFLCEPVILSKTTQRTRTVAFELNEVDYALLANEQIWDNTVRVAEFVGNRFWRKYNVKFTPTQAKNSVRDSWNH